MVFLGMNPGPFGMAQNGCAFWGDSRGSGLDGFEREVDKPISEHQEAGGWFTLYEE